MVDYCWAFSILPSTIVVRNDRATKLIGKDIL